jgi:hypothetical protein
MLWNGLCSTTRSHVDAMTGTVGLCLSKYALTVFVSSATSPHVRNAGKKSSVSAAHGNSHSNPSVRIQSFFVSSYVPRSAKYSTAENVMSAIISKNARMYKGRALRRMVWPSKSTAVLLTRSNRKTRANRNTRSTDKPGMVNPFASKST